MRRATHPSPQRPSACQPAWPPPEKQGPIVAELLQALRKPPDGGPHSEVLLLLSGLLRGHGSETVPNDCWRCRNWVPSRTLRKDSCRRRAGSDPVVCRSARPEPTHQAFLSHGDPLRVNRATAALGVLLSATPTENAISALVAQLSDGGDLRTLAENRVGAVQPSLQPSSLWPCRRAAARDATNPP